MCHHARSDAKGEDMTDQTVTQRIHESGCKYEPYVIDQRRYFHAHPELSMKEVKTSDAIAAELDKMGVSYTRLMKQA